MKKFKCLDCDETFKVATSDDALESMMPHYMETHKEIMETNTTESKEEWMKRFYVEWEATPEIEE